LSHSHHNKAFADKLAEGLAKHSIEVWYSSGRIQGAEQWHDQIGEALGRCDWFLLALSPSAVKSPWVLREYLYALDQPRFRGRIVPLVARTCNWKKFSWTLGAIVRIDFRKDFNSGLKNLLGIWGIDQ
jgi:hypothetical protein